MSTEAGALQYDLNGNLTAAKQGSNVLWELDYNRKDQTTAARD